MGEKKRQETGKESETQTHYFRSYTQEDRSRSTDKVGQAEENW
jgi:hypothetical protein